MESIPGLHKRLKIRALALKRNLLAVKTALTTKYVYIKSTTVQSPELQLAQPLIRPPASMPLSPESEGGGGGGHTRLRVRGWASPNSDDWRQSLALCLLCGFDPGGGGGESLTREKVRGAPIHKARWEIPM